MNFLKKSSSKPAAPVQVPAAPAVTPKAPTGEPKPASGFEAKPAVSASPAPVAATPARTAPSTTPLPAITITHDAIAQAAYFRWQRYGGDEATNWKLAEQELREEAAKLGITV